MPTYQYACTECGHAFEQFQSFTDDALTACPECSGRLRKVFNAVGVVFKGSGFYRTDSRSADGAGSSSSPSSTGASTGPAGSGTASSTGGGESGGSSTSPSTSTSGTSESAA